MSPQYGDFFTLLSLLTYIFETDLSLY